MMSNVVSDWQVLLKQFKEKLAQRLWSIPAISETEKEIVYKEYLHDLDSFERALAGYHEESESQKKLASDENDLLRSLLGVSESELRNRALIMGASIATANNDIADLRQERDAAAKQLSQAQEENTFLRKRIMEIEKKADEFRLAQHRLRQEDVRYFSESQEKLKNEFLDLQSRLGNLRELFTQTNQKLVSEKQSEISLLQKKLLEDMEGALKRKQQLSWVEEDMFAKGVAHKVRAALVSVQGQLFLTLERLGLLDPETKSEATWAARLKLLIEGGDELIDSFHSLQSQFLEVTKTLDDYLHLTGRRELSKNPLDLKALVKEIMADLYSDRRPTLSIEFLSDDPLPFVSADKELMGFVVKTLLRNAVEAIPHQTGKIEIALKHERDRQQIQILVRDTGAGIAAPVVPRLFQPFLTTKEGRQGLSLSRAKRYVELHDGVLEMLTTGKDGTTFRFTLPLERGV